MNNIKAIAQEIGAAEVSRRIQRAETLESRSQTHVGVIGPANCGKTTLFNGILQKEVRAPSVLPYDGLPLRVVFDRTADDERFECVHVFHKEWGNKDVVLYEFSSDKVLKDEQCIDEMDFLFYLSPLAHFLTAEDKKALQFFEGIPVQVIATQCDRVAADDLFKAKEFAAKACERMELAAPIFADLNSWQSVSEMMRGVLPTTAALLESRKAHLAKIEKSCKAQLIGYAERMIEAEKSNLQALQAQHEAQLRKEKLAFTTANRVYQEMKLRCSTASNELADQVRASIQRIDDFAQRMIAEGRQCKYDTVFQNRLSKMAEDLLNEQILTIESKLKTSLNAIVSEALSRKVITEKELQALRQNGNLPRGNQGIHFSKGTGNEMSYLLQSVLGVGTVSAATLVSRATPPWSIGLIAASILAGGATYFVRNELSRTARREAVIKDWARSCADEMQSTLVPAIQQAYKTLSTAMHMPLVEQTTPAELPAETELAAQLQAIVVSLKK